MDIPKKVPIIKKIPDTATPIQHSGYNQNKAQKDWRDSNKEYTQAYNFCYRNNLDWEKYKIENGLVKPVLPSNKRIIHRFDTNGIELKYCSHCDDWIPLDRFSKTSGKTWDGLRHFCKDYDKEYREKNKEPYTLVTCNECGKSVEQKYLTEHMKNVHLEDAYSNQCPACLITFKSESTFNHHLTTETHLNAIKIKGITEDDMLKTKKTIFNVMNGMDNTDATVPLEKKKPIIVKKCINDKPFDDSNADDKGTVKKMPLIIKKETATTAGLAGVSETDITKTSDKYGCDLCPFVGTNASSLNQHKQRVHGPRQYNCNYIFEDGSKCNRSFVRNDHLTTHVRSVHERVTIQCPYCKKQIVFRDKSRHLDGCAKKMVLKNYPGASKWEKMVFKFCIENKIKFEPQKKYPNLKKKNLLPYDFLIQDWLLLETHGGQHYSPMSYKNGQQAYLNCLESDRLKKEYAEKNNIELLIIDVRTHNTYEKICKVIADKLKIVNPIITDIKSDYDFNPEQKD